MRWITGGAVTCIRLGMFPNYGTLREVPARLVLTALLSLLLGTSLAAQNAAPGSEQVPDVPQTKTGYVPITPKQRLTWFVRSTAGPESLLLAGPISAGWGTAFDHPKEYNTSWEGFGQRYGMRLTGISTGNAMEASLGAIWGEDPRYFRTQNEAFKKRVVNVVDLTFRAYRPDGERHFAYARMAGNVGNNFLSNTWRVPSDSDWQSALIRIAEGIGGKAVGNAASEFLPDLIKLIRRR